MLYSFGTNPVHDSTCVCSTKINFVNWHITTYHFDYKWKRKCRTDKWIKIECTNSSGLKNHATHAQKGREWYQKKKKSKPPFHSCLSLKTTSFLLICLFISLSLSHQSFFPLSLSLVPCTFLSIFLNLFYLRPSLLLLLGRVKSMIQRRSFSCLLYVLGLLLYSASLVCGGDIVHHDDSIPQRPGCNNNFVLVRNLSRICFDFVCHDFQLFCVV